MCKQADDFITKEIRGLNSSHHAFILLTHYKSRGAFVDERAHDARITYLISTLFQSSNDNSLGADGAIAKSNETFHAKTQKYR